MQVRKGLPRSTKSTPRTKFRVGSSGRSLFSCPGTLQLLADQGSTILHELLIFPGESSRKVTVDVELAGDLASPENRCDDLGLGLKRARQVTGILRHIVDDHRLARGSSGSANSLVQRNAGVRRHGSLERAQHQLWRVRIFIQHVEADPVV